MEKTYTKGQNLIGDQFIYEFTEPKTLPPISEIKGQDITKSDLVFKDPFLIEKLFPWLFFTGVSGYNSTYYHQFTLKKYAKMRLGSVNGFYSLDINFNFYLYDRIKKEAILKFNQKVHMASESGLIKQLKATYFYKRDLYHYLGQRISYKLTGTTQYNHQYYHRLREIMFQEEIETGKAKPDLFITLNEGDRALLIEEIQQYVKVTSEDPYSVTKYFFKKQKILNKQFLAERIVHLEYLVMLLVLCALNIKVGVLHMPIC